MNLLGKLRAALTRRTTRTTRTTGPDPRTIDNQRDAAPVRAAT